MSAGTRTLVWLLLGLAPVAWLWWKGHPAIIDRPRKSVLWDQHSIWHLAAPFAYAFVGHFLGADGVVAGAVVALAWEVANRFPKDRQGGHFEFSDFVLGVLGAMLGAFVATLLGAPIV